MRFIIYLEIISYVWHKGTIVLSEVQTHKLLVYKTNLISIGQQQKSCFSVYEINVLSNYNLVLINKIASTKNENL